MDLAINQFQGLVPGNISQCSNLVYLGIPSNKLVGSIPPELGSLQRLQRLVIFNNSLTGPIPPSMGNLSSLQTLSASINYFEGSIPSTFGQLTSLSYLALGANNLSGTIPPSLYNLTSITLFSVPINQLHGSLPPHLGLTNFPRLEKLNIFMNRFSGHIPRSIANASNLAYIDIRQNEFSGDVPSLASLHNLEVLTLGSNSLGTGEDEDLKFLPSLVNRTGLQVLNMRGCNFGGMLPETLRNFSTKLRVMTVELNNIHRTIPAGIGNLISLTGLGLAANQFSGAIPSSLSRLSKLNHLALNNNNLSGAIPSSLGNLTSLDWISLMHNNLEGHIPASLGQYKHMEFMRLSSNNLNGSIPKEVMGLSSIFTLLDLSHNQLTGTLPAEIGQLTNLAVVDVSGNKLSGEIPTGLGSCISLTSLNMSDNLFHGTIPQSFSSLRAIDSLDLSSNNLSGQIPQFLEIFGVLQNLNLSYNDFEGEVPANGVFTNATVVSIIGNKRLCGGIPHLQLPKCSNAHKSNKQKLSFALKIVISITGGLISLTLVATVSYWLSAGRKVQVSSLSLLVDDLVMRLSFENLLKATDGFASTNLIGHGSFGSVYKGVLAENKTIVAVIVLDLQLRQASKSFMAECQALRGIRHRNLVKVLSACSSIDFQGNDFMALIYQYMPNGSLDEWLHTNSSVGDDESKNSSFHKRLNIAIDVASALNYLHHCCPTPIVHCDLKPSNILMDNDMTACVNDFGLARCLSEGAQVSSSNTLGIKGSIGYIAPRQCRIRHGKWVSTNGDVYSYGMLLLEMFTGKRPTDHMFKDGLNLHEFVLLALPSHVIEIVDPIVFVVEEGANIESHRNISGPRIGLNVEECSFHIWNWDCMLCRNTE